MTPAQLRAIVARFSAKVRTLWPSMACDFKRSESDGYEFRVSSGKAKAKRFGVAVFPDEDLPRIDANIARVMLRSLVTQHVEYCLESKPFR